MVSKNVIRKSSFPHFDVVIVESDDTIFTSIEKTRESALRLTNAAEKVRNCKYWKIVYHRNIDCYA